MTDQEYELRRKLALGRHDKAARKVYLAAILAALRPAERPFLAAMDAAAFSSIDRSWTRLAVAECNRELSTRERNQMERLVKRASTLAGIYGLTIRRGSLYLGLIGDPLNAVTGLHSDDGVALGD